MEAVCKEGEGKYRENRGVDEREVGENQIRETWEKVPKKVRGLGRGKIHG